MSFGTNGLWVRLTSRSRQMGEEKRREHGPCETCPAHSNIKLEFVVKIFFSSDLIIYTL